jgi:integrase
VFFLAQKSQIEPSRGHDEKNRSFAWAKAVHQGGEKNTSSIHQSLRRIDHVFERVKMQGLTFGEHASKKRLADRTIQTYRDVVKAYANYLFRTYGISDISKAKPRHAYEYMDKQIALYESSDPSVSAFTMRRFAHALHAFREASAVTGIYKGKLKLGDKRKLLARLNDGGVYRRSAASRTLKAQHSDYMKVQKQLQGSKSPNAAVIASIHQVQRYVGARITEVISMRKQDLTFHKNGKLTIRIKGKGGLVRFVTTDHKPTIDILKEQVTGKQAGAPVFQMKNSRGQDKSIIAAVKSLKENIRLAAIHAGVDQKDKKYTTHSARKAFAQEQMNDYAHKTIRQLQRETGERITADPALKKKYDQTLRNVRAKITPTSPNKNRDLNHKEFCTWLVSTDLGHGRLDVVRYYASYPIKR